MVMYTHLYLKWITNKYLLYIAHELCSVLYGSLGGGEFGGEWIHGICMAEFLQCSPETITILLTGYEGGSVSC